MTLYCKSHASVAYGPVCKYASRRQKESKPVSDCQTIDWEEFGRAAERLIATWEMLEEGDGGAGEILLTDVVS